MNLPLWTVSGGVKHFEKSQRQTENLENITIPHAIFLIQLMILFLV